MVKAGRGRYPNKDCNIAVCSLCIVKMMTLRVICIVVLLTLFAQIMPYFALYATFDLAVGNAHPNKSQAIGGDFDGRLRLLGVEVVAHLG